jgi:hypothetical protein
MSADRFTWRAEDVEVSWPPGQPIDLRHCTRLPCQVHGDACLPLWEELEDGRVDQLLEERFFDVGEDDYPLWFPDPDR